MKTRQFMMVLGVLALVAVIYSPSTIGISGSPGGDGGSGPTDTSQSGTSMFLSYLRSSGYHVVVANSSQQLLSAIGGQSKVAYFLIGPDRALASSEVDPLVQGNRQGRISLLISDGNTTNNSFLQAIGASVSGLPITDPLSSFQDSRVFVLSLSLGQTASGVIDIASPISFRGPVVFNNFAGIHTVAATSAESTVQGNSTAGPKTVIAASSSATAGRQLLITDSAPFSNFLFNYTDSNLGVNEKAFVSSMVSWVAPSKSTTIVFDAAHYNAAQAPKFGLGIPIGPIVAYALEQDFSSLNGYYNNFPSQVSGFLSGFGINISPAVAGTAVAALVLLSVYGAVTRWFAPEKRGKDDQPIPSPEKTFAAESRARLDFLQTSRSKSFYVATLAQLYEVLDSIVHDEFGKRISALEDADLEREFGAYEAVKAKNLFHDLSRLHDYATGERRFLIPPVFGWKGLTSRLTRESEEFLNQLGITIAGKDAEEAQGAGKVESLMSARVRA